MSKKTRRGKRSRSNASEQRRFVNRLVSSCAHRDLQKYEAINVLSPKEVERALERRFDGVFLHAPIIFAQAEILSDSRGEGSLQKVATT